MTLRFGILTLSDRSSRGERPDSSGPALARLIEAENWSVAKQALLPDKESAIRKILSEWADEGKVDVILTTGGTGFSPRDLTLEAVGPLLDRPVEGFGELFRMLSFQEIGSAAMLSRAVAGVTRDGLLVFAMPGSPAAVKLACERLVLPELGHLIEELSR